MDHNHSRDLICLGCEVEMKAPVEDADIIEGRIREMGGEFLGEKVQEDFYLSHPCRDLRGADEALRLRREGERWMVTFKGARKKGNLKIREELEFAVGDGAVALEVFGRLGFAVGAKVFKIRREYSIIGATIAVDRVEKLGGFVEIEASKEGDEEERSALVEKVAALIGVEKGLFTTSSYVELLESRSSLSMDSI